MKTPNPKYLGVLLTGLFMGAFFSAGVIFAQSAGVINACVRPLTGTVRIITGSQTCLPNETALSWNQQGVQGPAGPQGPAGSGGSSRWIVGGGEFASSLGNPWAGQDFSESVIQVATFTGENGTPPAHIDMSGADFSNSAFDKVVFQRVNFNNSDLSGGVAHELVFSDAGVSSTAQNANFSDFVWLGGQMNGGPDFTGANLTNAQIEVGVIENMSFANVNFTGATFLNPNFKNVDFTGATGLSSGSFTGATWNNVTCPDGTNSNSNGNTCNGHY